MHGAETSTFRKVIKNAWREILNVVLKNDGEDELGRSCEKMKKYYTASGKAGISCIQ